MNNYIFIIDLDGTIIGDCKYQNYLYNIKIILDKFNIKYDIQNDIKEAYSNNSLLIRPYFTYFITKMKSFFPSSYFYIYTSSLKEWALKEISLIEKQNNIKFNRPIFTRDNCILTNDGKYKKCISTILKNNKIKNSQILIIDNNDTFIDMKDNLILCPSYNYIFFQDIWNYIPSNAYSCHKCLNYLNKIINLDYISPYNVNDLNHKNKTLAYKWLYKKCYNINKKNKKYIKDLFWKKLADYIILNNINDFNKTNINLINNYINEK